EGLPYRGDHHQERLSERTGAGRIGRGSAGPHSDLRGIGRADGGYWRVLRQLGIVATGRSHGRVLSGGGADRAQGDGEGDAAGRRPRGGGGGRGAARAHHAQSQRDAPGTCGAAEYSGDAREAGGLAERTGAFAV